MTYQVWWSSSCTICILFHFFPSFPNPGLSSATATELSGQARVLAGLVRHCYLSPTVGTPWGIIFLKISFPKILTRLEIGLSSAIILNPEQLVKSLKYRDRVRCPLETAGFDWRARKSYPAKQCSRLNYLTKIWQFSLKCNNFLVSFKWY